MMLLLGLLLQASNASSPAPAAPDRDIVVTGHRLDDTDRALRECLARHCPPDEDARAALAHAENQFVGGAYEDARRTLQGAINRNRQFAKTYPVPVSDLLRANARIDLHLGEADLYHVGQVDSLVALKAGLPANDGRVLVQRVELADADARIGKFEPALEDYRVIADDAHRAGLPAVEGYARLRRVVLLTAISNANAGYEPDLKAAVRWFANRPDLSAFAAAARMMEAQHFAKKGEPAELDALVAAAAKGSVTPQLLYAPALLQTQDPKVESQGSTTGGVTADDYDGQCADVGFWVTAEGKVTDVDILRGGPKLRRDWLKPVMAGIAQRRYAPMIAVANGPGVLRVERYSLTAFWSSTSRSRIRVREAQPRIEMIDLTAEQPASALPVKR